MGYPRLPLEGQHIGTNSQNGDITLLQGGLIPQSAQLLVDIQVAQGDSALLLHVDGLVVSSHREPSDGGVGETGVLLVAPLEGRSHGVSAESLELLLVGLAGLRVHGVLPADPHVLLGMYLPDSMNTSTLH